MLTSLDPVLSQGCAVLSLAQFCPTLCVPMDYSPPGSSVHGIFQQEYWSGLPCPPPGDLPNPGIDSRSPALQADSVLAVNDKGSPRILEWVAYPFSRASFQLRNQTRVSCIPGVFFTNLATREAHFELEYQVNESQKIRI